MTKATTAKTASAFALRARLTPLVRDGQFDGLNLL